MRQAPLPFRVERGFPQLRAGITSFRSVRFLCGQDLLRLVLERQGEAYAAVRMAPIKQVGDLSAPGAGRAALAQHEAAVELDKAIDAARTEIRKILEA
jgi:hypothetical protein